MKKGRNYMNNAHCLILSLLAAAVAQAAPITLPPSADLDAFQVCYYYQGMQCIGVSHDPDDFPVVSTANVPNYIPGMWTLIICNFTTSPMDFDAAKFDVELAWDGGEVARTIDHYGTHTFSFGMDIPDEQFYDLTRIDLSVVMWGGDGERVGATSGNYFGLITPAPEPATVGLAAIGLIVLCWRRLV